MRHGDRVQRAFQSLQPEIEEFVERRKYRAEIVILPDIALQQPGVIRPPVENVGCGQPIAFKLPPKVLRHHGPLHPIIGDVSRLSSPLQASKLTKLFPFKATVLSCHSANACWQVARLSAKKFWSRSCGQNNHAPCRRQAVNWEGKLAIFQSLSGYCCAYTHLQSFQLVRRTP